MSEKRGPRGGHGWQAVFLEAVALGLVLRVVEVAGRIQVGD